jgi:hypothetical protein
MAYDRGAGVLIAGILLVALIVIGIVFFFGRDFKGIKDVNVNVELPKAQTPATGEK